ncbi:RluA family pseudouridine synthase [Lactobacillus sp. S2-2]|uniref:RluA family pseudouridine synthase n=1 Tax=Lactobacillus sp. S2-2 TaxID=2692917 RepID=UPI001F45DE54|nr:RluA family pseudouridine synthase [Lactobacillus sp. S2-2]MCF6514742.1 RluA family pseudouridine synthase [Lactobacillus sp. S2-2]
MIFKWKSKSKQSVSLKQFMLQKGFSVRLYNELKNNANSFKINNKIENADIKIDEHDLVEIMLPNEESDDNVVSSDSPLEIIFENDNWLVVNKRAGTTSVPGPSNRDDTLVNQIKGHLIKQNSNNLKPHIITRLDRFTSGVVLVAKNRLSNSIANQELANKEINKTYLVVVNGLMEKNHGLINFPIGKNEDEIRRHKKDDGQNALTEYWVKGYKNKTTILEIKLHTGRTHQIRVHMAESNHPLLGDQLYDGPLNLGINRQALHAKTISFYDKLDDCVRTFEAPIPDDMLKIM